MIFGVGGMDGELQECQWAVFGEQETRGCTRSGVGDAVASLVARCYYLFVEEMADIGGVELDCEELRTLVETGTAQALKMEYVYTATVPSTIWHWQESADHFDLVLG